VLTAVRQYFTARASELGYVKHYDGFATDNIPNTRFDRAYHVSAFTFTGVSQNQTDLSLTASVTVRLFFKGFRDVDVGIESATNGAEAYIDNALLATNRLGAEIKNVIFGTLSVAPYGDTNDNQIVSEITFTASLNKGIC